MVHGSLYMKCPEKAKFIETKKSRLVVAWGREWEWELIANRNQVSFGGDGNSLKLDCSDGRTTLKIYYKSLNHTLKVREFYGA